jgi:serine/threonine protein kinase
MRETTMTLTAGLSGRLGRYEILRRLGQGGMGTVYLAQDTQQDREVALKVPRLDRGPSAQVRERFLREAKAAATLDHPNICSVYDAGEIDGVLFATMAFIDGRPLTELIRAGKRLPERAVAVLVRKLARALAAAHEKGVVHRDLKPANVLLTLQNEPVITDFGLALRLGQEEARLTGEGAVLGTPAYMPPEQVNGETAAMGPACDIYSLGVLLYELLTGRLPFEGPPPPCVTFSPGGKLGLSGGATGAWLWQLPP